MKTKFKTSLIILIPLFLLACSKDLQDKDAKLDTFSDVNIEASITKAKALAYDYPIKPGSKKWQAFTSKEQMLAVCQIPSDVINRLTTRELVDVCLAYPLLNDIYAFQTLEGGVMRLSEEFNGLKELSNRPDAVRMFIEAYEEKVANIDALSQSYSEVSKGDFVVELSTIEVLLSSDVLLKENLDDMTLKDAVKSLFDGYNRKLSKPSYFQGIGLQTNLLSRQSVISRRNHVPVEEVVKQLQFNAESIDRINNNSIQIIKD